MSTTTPEYDMDLLGKKFQVFVGLRRIEKAKIFDETLKDLCSSGGADTFELLCHNNSAKEFLAHIKTCPLSCRKVFYDRLVSLPNNVPSATSE